MSQDYTPDLFQGLLFWLFKAGFEVNSDTVKWYRSSYGTDVDSPEIASPIFRAPEYAESISGSVLT